MTNQTCEFCNENVDKNYFNTLDKYLGCLHAIIIFFAFTGNTISFLIFRFDQEMKKISSLFILSFVVIIDNLAVITWNLNHLIRPHFGIEIENLSLFTCKFFVFIQYFSLQCNGLLLSLVIIDRYLAISRVPGSFASKLPFCTLKTAFIWSISVVILTFLANMHVLILNKLQFSKKVNRNITESLNSSSNETIQLEINESSGKCIYYLESLYNTQNLIVHSLIPSTIMIIFSLLTVKFLRSENFFPKNSTLYKNYCRNKRITVNLLAVSVAYALMTLPPAIFFAFIYDNIPPIPWGRYLNDLFDFISFANNASIFFSSFLTNLKFRKCFILFVKSYLLNHFTTKSRIKPLL